MPTQDNHVNTEYIQYVTVQCNYAVCVIEIIFQTNKNISR